MSLLNRTSGAIIDIDGSKIYTGAGTFTLHTPSSGKYLLISDIILSAQNDGVYQILVGGAVKRHIYLSANGGFVENRQIPIVTQKDETLQLKIITASASCTISATAEELG